MPIEIRARVPFHGKVPTSPTPVGRHASFYVQKPVPPTADPELITRVVRDQEALGFDSTLVPQNSARPDVWSVTGWALAATTRIKLVAAHRVGLQQPTLAARTLATLDRLSGGRQLVHIIQGRTDEDMRRDGDWLAKSDRYRRSHEYMKIFTQELTAEEPFDFKGEFYQVEQAWSGVKPVQRPYPTISAAGSSDAGIRFAAEHADVYAVACEPLAQTAQQIARVRAAATEFGRSPGFWMGGSNIILGATDDDAWSRVDELITEVVRFQQAHDRTEAAGIAMPGSPLAPDAAGRRLLRIHESGQVHDDVYFTGLAQLTGHAANIVGSPKTVAEALLRYYDLGVGVITLGGVAELYAEQGAPDLTTDEDRTLLAELIDRLRTGAADRDRLRPAGTPSDAVGAH